MPPEPRRPLRLHFVVGTRPNFVKAAPVLRLEPILKSDRPDWLVVFADVNSTLAAAAEVLDRADEPGPDRPPPLWDGRAAARIVDVLAAAGAPAATLAR